jgi:hypothetical protein
MQTKNQHVDFPFLNVLQDVSVWPPHANERTRLTEFARFVGQNFLDSTIEMLLKSMKLLRVVYVARMNDVQHIEF